MPRPLVYLDECVRAELAILLRFRGFVVTTARERGMLGLSDHEQLVYATRLDAIIVTYNGRHFRRLDLAARPHGGIAVLPDSPLDRQAIRAAMLLDWAGSFPDYRSRLFRWHELQQQLIQGMRLPGYREDEVRQALGQII